MLDASCRTRTYSEIENPYYHSHSIHADDHKSSVSIYKIDTRVK